MAAITEERITELTEKGSQRKESQSSQKRASRDGQKATWTGFTSTLQCLA